MISVDALVQALGQIVYSWSPGSGELRWGGDYVRILGYDERSMGATTESWTARVHPDDLARVLHEVEACTRERRFYDLEYRFRRADGGYVWMHDRGVPFFAAGGELERIVGVFSDVSERKRAQQALLELAQRVVQTEESERRKIHRELHDRVGQGLSSLLISLDVLRQQLPPEAAAAVQPRLDDVRALALKAVDDTRDVMADLRPPALDDFGLVSALRAHAESFTARTGIEVHVAGGTAPPELSGIGQTALFRIAQEALANVAKHAGATRVDIELHADADGAELGIADDGAGFDLERAQGGPGWGLKTMRERAEAVGATLRIESRPGEGTVLSVRLPR
jgi:two-component system, NarL family, sensor histidine kinase UhpB